MSRNQVNPDVRHVLVNMAEAFKDAMESLGVGIAEVASATKMSPGRIRRILRAQRKDLDFKTIHTIAYSLGLKVEVIAEDLFIYAVKRGMENSKKDKDAGKALTPFRRRYAIADA